MYSPHLLNETVNQQVILTIVNSGVRVPIIAIVSGNRRFRGGFWDRGLLNRMQHSIDRQCRIDSECKYVKTMGGGRSTSEHLPVDHDTIILRGQEFTPMHGL